MGSESSACFEQALLCPMLQHVGDGGSFSLQAGFSLTCPHRFSMLIFCLGLARSHLLCRSMKARLKENAPIMTALRKTWMNPCREARLKPAQDFPPHFPHRLEAGGKEEPAQSRLKSEERQSSTASCSIVAACEEDCPGKGNRITGNWYKTSGV